MVARIDRVRLLQQQTEQILRRHGRLNDLADRYTQQEILDEEKNEKLESLRNSNRNSSQNIHLRREYSGKMFFLVLGWLVFISLLLLLSGLNSANDAEVLNFIVSAVFNFRLSDGVLISLVSSLTVSVLGLFGIVLKYLFPNSKS